MNRLKRNIGLIIATLCLSSAGLVAGESAGEAAGEKDGEGALTLKRLHANTGISLQWISWKDRGKAAVREVDGAVYLSASQIDMKGQGTLWLDGQVVESGADYFILDGIIRIANAPDAGRECAAQKKWHFAITQNRKYYRLREFEWCDGLTDYIDIYF